MNVVKVKVTKKERLYYDGKYISNGFWAALASSVKLSDKELAALIEEGTQFSRIAGELLTGEDREGPSDLKKRIWETQLTDKCENAPINPTGWSWDIWSDGETLTCSIWRRNDGELVAVSPKLVCLLRGRECHQLKELGPITAYGVTGPLAIAMPVRVVDLKAEASVLTK